MISSQSYKLTMAYQEMADLDDHVPHLSTVLSRCNLIADFHGVTIYFRTAEERDTVFDMALEATEKVKKD